MKTILSLILLLLLSTHLHAQSPQLSLIAGVGAWRDWPPIYDGYANDYQHWQPQAGIGMNMEFQLFKHLDFAPEAGLELYPMRHEYHNSGSRMVTSDLYMISGRLSPGFVVKPLKSLSFRLGISGLISAFTAGNYLWYRWVTNVGLSDSTLYTDHFERIRNPFMWGPEMAIGYRFPESKSGQFGIRISSFLGMNGVFRKDFFTPFNPRIFQSRLELAYTFPAKERGLEKLD